MKGFTLIELAIVIVIAALLAAVAVPIYNGIVDDAKWSEAKTAVGTIRSAVDTYKAKMGGDISSLGLTGFSSGDNDLVLLKLDDDAFEELQYFNSEDFVMTWDAVNGAGDGTDGEYIITVTGVANHGQSANGPTGSGTFTSATGAWSGDLQ